MQETIISFLPAQESAHTRRAKAAQRDPVMWLVMSEDPEFRALVASKRRFLLTCWVLVASSYLALSMGAALAPVWFATLVIGEVNIGLILAMGEVLLVLLVATLYVRKACQDFDRSAAVLAARFSRLHDPLGTPRLPAD